MDRSRALLLTIVLAALAGKAKGDVQAPCWYSPQGNPDTYHKNTYWVTRYDKVTNYQWAPLSKCQAETMGFDATQKILLGANSNAAIVGVPVGPNGGGICQSPKECMPICQALCCLAEGCRYAVIGRDTTGYNYEVYDDTAYYFYCNLFKTGSYSKSDASTLCHATSTALYTSELGLSYTLPRDCPTIANVGLGMNKTSFDDLLYVQNPATYATCPPTSRRRLVAKPAPDQPAPDLRGIKPFPNVTRALRAMKDKINAMTFKEIKHAVDIRGKAFAIKALKKKCKKL